MEYRVIESHRSEFPQPIKVRCRDVVSVTDKASAAFPDWVFCATTPEAPGGWVPRSILRVEGTHGQVLEDYDATELDADAGDVVEGLRVLGGWVWCRDRRFGRCGWLPLDKLRQDDPTEPGCAETHPRDDPAFPVCSERCVVRRFRAADVDAFMAYRNDLDWMRHQGYKGLTRSEYETALLAEPCVEDGAQYAIALRDTDELIGDLYLRTDNDAWWIGYTITPARARQGFASEVVRAMVNALEANGAVCVNASVEPGNTASIGLLEKLGFQLDAATGDELVYTLNLARQQDGVPV